MEMEGLEKINLESEAHGLVDSNQFSENQLDPNTYELLAGAVSAEEEVDNILSTSTNDHLPVLHESREPERTPRNGRYNLRKSLAWDSAFFTSAGVLDPEELSSMIIGTDKGEKHLLPGIQEDISGSTESISTLESDSLTLETLEDDLFVDIRASIQRSSKKSSNLTNSSTKTAAREVVDSAAISALKKEDDASLSKNPKPSLKKTSGLQTVRMPKCLPKQNTGQLGSGKAITQDSSHSQVLQMTSIAKSGDKNSLLTKPPKTISNSISTSTTAKRDSVGTGRAKSECGSSKLGGATNSGKGTQPTKVSVLSGARRALPKPTVSSKSLLLGSVTTGRVQSTGSSTVSDSSSSMSCGIPAKSPLMTARRNLCKSGNIGTGPSGSIPKTPPRAVLKNKPPSTLSAYLMSAKISSSVSPASSISEWSSVSSSSSSVVNERSNNSRISLDISSSTSMDGDTILLQARNHSAGQTAAGKKNEGVTLPCNSSKKSATRIGTLQASMKPSGLRMPSPKIGFFDGVKSSVRTPNGHQQSQSGLHTVFPKNGTASCSSIRSSNGKLRSTKVQTARMVASTNSDSPNTMSPASFQEKSHASVNASCDSFDVKDPPSLSLGVKGNASEESCRKAQKVQAEDAGTGAVVKADFGDLNNEMDLNMHTNMGTRDIKTSFVEESNVSGLEYIIDRIGDVVQVNRNHLKNNSHPICEAIGKESGDVKYQVEGLTGHNRGTYHNVHGQKNDTSESALPFPGSASESAGCRAPFALKNFFCGNECIDVSKELVTPVGDKTALVLPSSEQKENC